MAKRTRCDGELSWVQFTHLWLHYIHDSCSRSQILYAKLDSLCLCDLYGYSMKHTWTGYFFCYLPDYSDIRWQHSKKFFVGWWEINWNFLWFEQHDPRGFCLRLNLSTPNLPLGDGRCCAACTRWSGTFAKSIFMTGKLTWLECLPFQKDSHVEIVGLQVQVRLSSQPCWVSRVFLIVASMYLHWSMYQKQLAVFSFTWVRIILPWPVKLNNNRKSRWTPMIQTHEKCRWTREVIALRKELKQFGMESSEIAKPVWFERCLRMRYVLQHLPPPPRLWRWNQSPQNGKSHDTSNQFSSFQSNMLKFVWA